MNGADMFIVTLGIVILFIASIAVYTYPEFFIVTIIFLICLDYFIPINIIIYFT